MYNAVQLGTGALGRVELDIPKDNFLTIGWYYTYCYVCGVVATLPGVDRVIWGKYLSSMDGG
jgi:hypothetical protein